MVGRRLPFWVVPFALAGLGVIQSSHAEDSTDVSTPTAAAPEEDSSSDQGAVGAAVSQAARGLKDVDGPRDEEAKKLKDAALQNNEGYQNALATRNANANAATSDDDEDSPDETARSGKDDNPGQTAAADHAFTPELPDRAETPDHPDAPDRPDLPDAAGKPDLPELPDRPDHPGKPGS